MKISYADVVATAAAAVSIVSLWLHWLNSKQERRDKAPLLTIEPAGAQAPAPGWRRFRVTLRSRDNMGYAMTRITIVWPLSARVLPMSAVIPDLSTNAIIPPLRLDASGASRSLATNLRVQQAGKEATGYPGLVLGRGDTHSDIFLFSVPASIWSRMRWSFVTHNSRSSRAVFILLKVQSEDRSSAQIIRRSIRIEPTQVTTVTADIAMS